MRGLKIYLGIVTLLLVIALGLGVYVWYTIQNVQRTTGVATEVTNMNRELPQINQASQ